MCLLIGHLLIYADWLSNWNVQQQYGGAVAR
jgi:hypothetical protein